MDLREETLFYRRVFGVDGDRNQAQEYIWKRIKTRIYRKSNVEATSPETSRDFCIDIFNTINRKVEEK